jgi:hypothetical protein
MNEKPKIFFLALIFPCKLYQVVLFAMYSSSALPRFLSGHESLLFVVIAVGVLVSRRWVVAL